MRTGVLQFCEGWDGWEIVVWALHHAVKRGQMPVVFAVVGGVGCGLVVNLYFVTSVGLCFK